MKTITLCASVSAYRQVIENMHELEKQLLKVIVPALSLEMEQQRNYDLANYADRFDDQNAEHKYQAIVNHFPSLEKADAVLIVNQTKHGLAGYIGPNVLMEMAVALYLQKPIFLLNQPDPRVPGYLEIMGMKPVILDGVLHKLTAILSS